MTCSVNKNHRPILLLFVFFILSKTAASQVVVPIDSLKADSLRIKVGIKPKQVEDLRDEYDLGNLKRAIFNSGRKSKSEKKRSGISILPNVGANPTVGFQLGIKAVAGKRLGDDPKTLLSVASTSLSASTKGIINFYVNHNVFTPGNKWNYQGSIVIARAVTQDYGVGIGRNYLGNDPGGLIMANPGRQLYKLNSLYFSFREKAYRNIAPDFFLGGGIAFDVRRNITGDDAATNTPFYYYNLRHGYPQTGSSANGFLLNAEYITRDNPNRAYKGIYADVGVRVNQTWIGSTKNSLQLTTDFRKYISLSRSSPEHVIALWNWGSYLLAGNIPYLELPGTNRDGSGRSGRAYVTQYFKGTKFNDTEAEYRFPILKNRFLGGVIFGNLQTGNDEQGTRLFEVFQPGYGAGLRVLFNKRNRTNLALDYAFGKFNRSGFFLGLNEAF